MKLFRLNYLKPISIFLTIICLILLFNGGFHTNRVTAQQTSDIPSLIKIGIDSSAKSIGGFNDTNKNNINSSDEAVGFCKVFGEQLKMYLESQYHKPFDVTYTEIVNKNLDGVPQYKENQRIHRYDSLKAEHQGEDFFQHMICGTNTNFWEFVKRDSTYQDVIDRYNWNHVNFSNTFHKTGIKLLLRSEIYNQLKEESFETPEKLKLFFNEKPILVVSETTTAHQLETLGLNVKDVRKRSEALNLLLKDDNPYHFYASDTLIIKTLLEESYEKNGYTIYPDYGDDYLPNTQIEEYGIVISREIDELPYNNDLKKAINHLLPQNYGEENEKINNPKIEEVVNQLKNLEQELKDNHGQDPIIESEEPKPEPYTNKPTKECSNADICLPKIGGLTYSRFFLIFGLIVIIGFIFGAILTYILLHKDLRDELVGSFIPMILNGIKMIFKFIGRFIPFL